MAFRFMHIGHSPICSVTWYLLDWARRFFWRRSSSTGMNANRRRVRSQTGKELLRQRGEYLERAGAHLYDTGGMRRVHLRGKKNIAKRALIHAAAFNLSLILRIVLGAGTARQAANRLALCVSGFYGWMRPGDANISIQPARLGCGNRFSLSS